LDAYLNKTIPLANMRLKTLLDNESVELGIDLNELITKNNCQDQNILERIMKKKILSLKPSEQRDALTTLLWDAKIKNKKIANISFKQSYEMLSKNRE